MTVRDFVRWGKAMLALEHILTHPDETKELVERQNKMMAETMRALLGEEPHEPDDP